MDASTRIAILLLHALITLIEKTYLLRRRRLLLDLAREGDVAVESVMYKRREGARAFFYFFQKMSTGAVVAVVAAAVVVVVAVFFFFFAGDSRFHERKAQGGLNSCIMRVAWQGRGDPFHCGRWRCTRREGAKGGMVDEKRRRSTQFFFFRFFQASRHGEERERGENEAPLSCLSLQKTHLTMLAAAERT